MRKGLVLLVVYMIGVALPARAWDPLQKAQRAAATAQAALAEGDTLRAVESILRAQALAPEDPRIRQALAETFYSTDSFATARTQYEALAESAPEIGRWRDDSLYNAGNAAFREGDLQSALDLFTRALVEDEAAPDDLRHNVELTQRLLEQQQDQESSEDQESSDSQEQSEDQEQNSDQEQQDEGESEQPPDQQEGDEQEQDSQQQQPPPEQAPQDSTQAQPMPLPENMTPEEAMRLLEALDFDEEELRESIQRRLRGEETESDHDW